jgi:DNA-nicking Smr family endonuclease
MRNLKDDERQLWDRLKQTVQPLSGRHSSKKKATTLQPKTPGETAPSSAASLKKTAKPSSATPSKTPAVTKPVAPSLAPFEEKTLRRLSRGLVGIDDTIDLHGMRQERAHLALGGFLRKSQARGDRIVLVVTGKGQEDGQHGRGVLRSVVPMWLAQPELRDFVVGFEEAGRRHGGGGALYVRIRRRREALLRASRA